jgi:hypothetical protein
MSGRWHLVDDPHDSWYRYRIWEGARLVTNVLRKEDAEQIIADHNAALEAADRQAATAEELGRVRAALETERRRDLHVRRSLANAFEECERLSNEIAGLGAATNQPVEYVGRYERRARGHARDRQTVLSDIAHLRAARAAAPAGAGEAVSDG